MTDWEDVVQTPISVFHVAIMRKGRFGILPRILADGIPATTFAAGANAIGGGFVDVNYHELMSNKESWPEDRMKGGQMRWEHSDIKDLSLPYVHKLFIRIVNGE